MITITNEQKVLVNVSALTEAGNPTPLNVIPEWNVTSGDVTLNVAVDGLSAEVVSGESETEAVITVTAKVNDTVELTNTFNLSVVLAQATSLSFTAGEPVLK